MRPRFGPSGARSLACGVILTSNVPVAFMSISSLDHKILLPRLVLALGVALEILAIEIHVAQVAGRIAVGLVVEVLRPGNAVQPAGGHRLRLYSIAELDDGHEAVAARAVPLLGAGIRARAERGQRSPPRRWKHHRRARLRIFELLHDRAVVALEAIDVAPRRLPLAEVV